MYICGVYVCMPLLWCDLVYGWIKAFGPISHCIMTGGEEKKLILYTSFSTKTHTHNHFYTHSWHFMYVKWVPILCSNIKITTPNRQHIVVVVMWLYSKSVLSSSKHFNWNHHIHTKFKYSRTQHTLMGLVQCWKRFYFTLYTFVRSKCWLIQLVRCIKLRCFFSRKLYT